MSYDSRYQEPYIPPPPPSVMAIISLVTGILGLAIFLISILSCCVFPGAQIVTLPVCVILGFASGTLGYFGMQECKTGLKSGHGMALAGTICGATGGILSLVLLIAGLAIFGWAMWMSQQQP